MVQRHFDCKALESVRLIKSRKVVRYVVLCLFVFLSFLFFKYTLTVFFNIAYHSPERASRPAEVNM